MTKFLHTPTARLAGRALVAAAGAVLAKYSTGDTSLRALIVAGLLVFGEVFTPLNPFVGYFKKA
jgi:hypothetical protein